MTSDNTELATFITRVPARSRPCNDNRPTVALLHSGPVALRSPLRHIRAPIRPPTADDANANRTSPPQSIAQCYALSRRIPQRAPAVPSDELLCTSAIQRYHVFRSLRSLMPPRSGGRVAAAAAAAAAPSRRRACRRSKATSPHRPPLLPLPRPSWLSSRLSLSTRRNIHEVAHQCARERARVCEAARGALARRTLLPFVDAVWRPLLQVAVQEPLAAPVLAAVAPRALCDGAGRVLKEGPSRRATACLDPAPVVLLVAASARARHRARRLLSVERKAHAAEG